MTDGKPTFVPQSVIAHFDAFATEYDQSTEWCFDATLTSILTAGVEGKCALDLGCGTGLLLRPIRDAGAHAFGADLSMAMLVEAAARVGRRLAQARAESLPYREQTFDVVISRQVLHYTREAEMLWEVRRVLKAGGELRLAQVTSLTDADYWFWSVLKSVLQPLRRRFYTPDFLLSLVTLCGFEVRDVRRHSVRRRYGMDDLFNRSPFDKTRRSEVVSWIAARLCDLPAELEASLDASGFAVNQYWTVLTAVRRAE